MEKLVLAVAVSAGIGLPALAFLIPALDMQTRVNIAGIAGPILSTGTAWCIHQFVKRNHNGGAAK